MDTVLREITNKHIASCLIFVNFIVLLLLATLHNFSMSWDPVIPYNSITRTRFNAYTIIAFTLAFVVYTEWARNHLNLNKICDWIWLTDFLLALYFLQQHNMTSHPGDTVSCSPGFFFFLIICIMSNTFSLKRFYPFLRLL